MVASSASTPLYPLIFAPIYLEKVWGGRALERLGRKLPGGPEQLIGESWELTDLAATSVSGAGGGAHRSVIANGPLAGISLHQAMAQFGPHLLGRLLPTGDGDFPLLVKLLDAQENLSVQVHPSPAYAHEHPEVSLKSEAWYILDAQPGAVIYKGIRSGVSADQLRQAVTHGSVADVKALLIEVPVKAGDCHYLPSGTCHALGAGIVIAEVQTPSDTTFRLYDWGRQGRQLHLEESLQCAELGPPTRHAERRSHVAGIFTTVSHLVRCEHFRIERVRMIQHYEQELPYDQPAVWIVLTGKARIDPGNGAESVILEKGQTALMPANLHQAHVSMLEDTVWLEVTFPQATSEQIA